MANDVCHNTRRMCDGSMCRCVCVCVRRWHWLWQRATTTTKNQHLARAQPQLMTGEMSTYAPLSRHRRQRPRHISDIYTSQQFQTADDIVSHDFSPPLRLSLSLPNDPAASLTPLATAKSVIIIFIVNISATHDKLI